MTSRQPELLILALYRFTCLQGFFGSLREELIIRKKNVSITICVIGGTATENLLSTAEKFKPGFSSLVSLASPAKTALNIIKGGAQRWNEVYYPKMDTSIFLTLYHIMPETMAGPVRDFHS